MTKKTPLPDREPIPRGKYIGQRIDKEPTDESEHFFRCPVCGGWVDKRDLGIVLSHEGPLPHPSEDAEQ